MSERFARPLPISIFYPALISNSGEITGYACDAAARDYPAFRALEGRKGEHCSAEATPRFSVNALTLPGNVLSLVQQRGLRVPQSGPCPLLAYSETVQALGGAGRW